MRNHPVALCVLFLMTVFPAIGCSRQENSGQEAPPAAVPGMAPEAAPPGAAPAGKLLFEEKCGVCHRLERTAYRKETREDWTRIVKDMQAKQEGWISDAEAARIIEYLATAQGKQE